ncbi:homocysteine S-methyltransferase family protein [Anaerosacchariphilus polymeriproducens]|uniref:Methionine synthase n=1 Tax=Anaerosacchariphilus polymeriproducens TaxID=1812858 RepID=A0A371B0C3_9FIRM|nr:homocysteine S-methyltransferase family protein [Anaerosacchariphilus polymeriproducens]RDU25246.1 5-methyltetrahydrofolate--homocysteine methyltransferase [Anaerosacchariphilus polymeriproducens]
MTKQEFREFISRGIVYLDGATGTRLEKKGMPVGVCPEKWVLDNPEVLLELQNEYIEAGSQIVYAPTFTANGIKLNEYGLGDKIKEINQGLVKLSKQAVQGKAYVAGNMTMTGAQLYPMGNMEVETLIQVYKEQAGYLAQAGADLIAIETMMSLAETRAAVLAVKEVCDLPIMASMSYNEDGRTLYGTDPITATVVLQSLGIDVIGINCSTGPDKMIPLIKQMKEYANVPILAKPNAGIPVLVDGKTKFMMESEEFGNYGKQLVEAGASILGGCCGTEPGHIEALKKATENMEVLPPLKKKKRALASERKTVTIEENGPFMIVGERINPTGKKKLQEELKNGRLDLVLTMAEEQENNGAHILDINMGMNGIDEKEMMLKVVREVSNNVQLPLCIDSSHVNIIEAALRIYPGRALINSISLEKEKFEKLIPIAKKYGAMFILLPLSDDGLPENVEEKKMIIHKILDRAIEIGIEKEDIIVDGLVATVGANSRAAIECFETIEYCKNTLGLATICGLSNISFGLPERSYVNSAFLSVAISKGLTMAIANPSQDLLMNIGLATDLLLNKEEADIRYINGVRAVDTTVKTTTHDKHNKDSDKQVGNIPGDKNPVYEAVVKGNRKGILELVKSALTEGVTPDYIISEYLIPGINQVGDLFDKQIYFLPQLISSAETMKKAIEYLEPMLKNKDNQDKLPTIVIATVEGDIHDIGKNLVALMLKNYGYQVIDLGKDVAKEIIVEAAIKERAAIIGLSALMTTTMVRMKDVVELVKEKYPECKVIIGGAVITQSYADEIGAAGYSKDAQDAVKLVKKLLSN